MASIPLPQHDFRALAYFCIRYFLKLGFLDGLPRSRKLDYPLASLGPQNKFFDGTSTKASGTAGSSTTKSEVII